MIERFLVKCMIFKMDIFALSLLIFVYKALVSVFLCVNTRIFRIERSSNSKFDHKVIKT